MRPYVYLLGVPNFANYEATAALIRIPRAGGDIEYVTVGEERLARTKHTYAFPLRGIHHCLQAFGLESLEEVDYIYTDHARLARWINSGPGYRKLEHDYIKLRLHYPRQRIRVIDHHDAHAASTFYPSPFGGATRVQRSADAGFTFVPATLSQASGSPLVDLCAELDLDLLRDQPLLPRLVEETPDSRAAALAVLQRELVDVHPDEPVGFRAVEPPAELQGVVERLLPVRQGVDDAGMQ